MSKTIIFFGSGPVAAASLRLLARDFKIEAVITKPQPAHHKQPFPVLALAAELDLKVLTASTKDEVSALFQGRPFTSEAGVIIDHGIILKPDVINYFPRGIINSHFSLLPRWRGADPISFAILEGDEKTGVSLMLINEKLDEGQLLAQDSLPISDDIKMPELTDQLVALSHALLMKTLPPYLDGQIKPYAQPDSEATYSRKLTKDDGIIDWSKPAVRLEREIRTFIDWPKSRTTLAGKEVIITGAHAVPSGNPDAKPGDIEVIKDVGVIMIQTGEGYLCIDKLKPAGKKEMSAKAFLAGYSL